MFLIMSGASGKGFDLNRMDLRRTDELPVPENQTTIIPHKELVRHFDVYSHCGISHQVVPPMFIPVGFFEDEVKIQYGGEKRLSGVCIYSSC